MNEITSSNLESVRKVSKRVACVPKRVRKETGRRKIHKRKVSNGKT
jgi:hypothetical protein